MKKDKTENCIIDCRVSDAEQLQGGSLEDQEMVGHRLAERNGWHVVRVFKKPHSATTVNRADIADIKQFIRSSPVPIHHYIIKCIDRFTRVGYPGYVELKGELEKLGVQLWDTYGIIQPKRNTLEHIGDFEYWWSVYSPSEAAEMLAAYQGKVEVRDILSRMIGAEIRLAREGFAIRRAPDGLKNKRILVEIDGATKERCVRDADPERAHYFKKMFELRVRGVPDKEIVDIINAEGFRTRVYRRWDRTIPSQPKIIGKRGSKLLTIKQLQRFIRMTEYAGVICEKWTHYQPVRAKYFTGLVSIDTFNRANRGKVFIQESPNGSLKLLTDYSPFGKVRRLSNNPVYPFKFLPCHICGKPMLGSAPKGKSGKRFPTYHCGGTSSRKHKYYGVPKADFEQNVRRYIASLEYEPEFFADFKSAVMRKFWEREAEITSQSARVNHNVGALKAEQVEVAKSVSKCRSAVMQRILEEEVDILQEKIEQAESLREKTEIRERDVKAFTKYVKKLMENPEEFLIDTDDMSLQRELFGLVFDEMPSYEKILNGTPKLSLAFKLSEGFKVDKSQLMNPLNLEWNTLEETILRWNEVFRDIDI